jgi:hypothetical protein
LSAFDCKFLLDQLAEEIGEVDGDDDDRNEYKRIIVGVEALPRRWLKLNGMRGDAETQFLNLCAKRARREYPGRITREAMFERMEEGIASMSLDEYRDMAGPQHARIPTMADLE